MLSFFLNINIQLQPNSTVVKIIDGATCFERDEKLHALLVQLLPKLGT